jgi:hypothetical protein
MRAYIASANVLAAIHTSYTKSVNAWAKQGKKTKFSWIELAAAVKSVYDVNNLPHDLPKNERRLQDVYKLYLQEGFESLISAKYGNKYALKVDEKLELLLMSAYTAKNKPFVAGANNGVHNTITLFLLGKLELANPTTGELLDPADFTKNGKPKISPGA